MRRTLALLMVLAVSSVAAADEPLKTFQDLEEATARIRRLAAKPLAKTVDGRSRYAAELLIFKDTTTGHEIWSLTNEQCTELANIERRSAWNCDGSLISFIGNRMYRGADGKLVGHGWSGHNYVARADASGRRKLIVTGPGGEKGAILGTKFNTWDRRDPSLLYYTAVKDGGAWRSWSNRDTDFDGSYLIRVRLDKDLNATLEPIHRFPNKRRKLLQNISDDNKLVIQDVNATKDKTTGKPEYMPNFYVIDLNRKPGEDGFVRTHPLAYNITHVEGHDVNNEYRVHGITINRGGNRVSWNYGSSRVSGEPIGFSVPADNLDARPAVRKKESDPWDQYMSHPGTWRDGRSAYFSGTSKKLAAAGVRRHWGLFIRLPGKMPLPIGKNAAGGHVSWCGNDPDWFFANTTRRLGSPETWPLEMGGKIVAGKADGSKFLILCDPYDRQRGGGKGGYDAIPRPNQSPDATKCWFHSSMLMPSNKYTGSYIVVFRRPHAPTALRLTGDRLVFAPHAVSGEVRSYLLRRKIGDGWKLIGQAPSSAGGFEKPADGTYMVTALEHSGLESDTSSPTITLPGGRAGRPVTDFDRTPPPAVGKLTVVAEADAKGQYRLKWAASEAGDVRYYNVYFSAKGKPEPVQARRIASLPAGATEYLDWAAPITGEAHYAVTAVDRQGNESPPARVSVRP